MIVTREAEWDDDERDKMLALAEYERHVCDCGLHESIADEDPDVKTEQRICPICKGLAVNRRVQADADERAVEALGKDPSPYAPRPDDGRHEWHRLKSPHEIEPASE